MSSSITSNERARPLKRRLGKGVEGQAKVEKTQRGEENE